MDAIEFLKSQHREVEKLFEQIEGLSDRAVKSRQRIFEKLADALALHATIEEKIFYPAAHSGKSEDILFEALEEHLAVKRVIADLMGCPLSDPTWKAKLSVLKEDVEHHVEEEEKTLFPMIRSHLDADRLAELGAELEAMTADLEDTQPRRKVPGETKRAASLGEMSR